MVHLEKHPTLAINLRLRVYMRPASHRYYTRNSKWQDTTWSTYVCWITSTHVDHLGVKKSYTDDMPGISSA